MVENTEFAVGISTLSIIVPEISISGFGGHITISGYQPLLQSFTDTFLGLYIVANPRYAVGISLLSLIVSNM